MELPEPGRLAGLQPRHSPDVIAEMPLEEAIDVLRNRMAVVGLASRTADEYEDEARGFARWCSQTFERPALLADLTTVNADQYVLALCERARARARPWSVGTRDHHVRQLRAVGGHVADALNLPGNPLARLSVRKARGERVWRGGDGLLDEEIMAVVRSLDPTCPTHIVTLAIIALGYEDGPRTSEITELTVDDVLIARSGGQELGPVIQVAQPAKGSPERILPLGVRCEEVIRRVVGNRRSGPLFQSPSGRPLTPREVQRKLRAAGRKARVALSVQRLRRSAASWQAAYGATSAHLDTVFGWAPDPRDVKSAHYVRPNIVQLIHAHQSRLSPLDRLELRVGPFLP